MFAVVAGGLLASLEVFAMLRAAGFRPVMPLGLGLTVAIILDALVTDARIMPAILVLAMISGLLSMMVRAKASLSRRAASARLRSLMSVMKA